MKDLILKNSEWLRRSLRFPYSTSMANRSGGKCCLGVLCSQEGVSIDLLLDMMNPRSVAEKSNRGLDVMPESIRWLLVPFTFFGLSEATENSEDAVALMTINDSSGTTDEEKVALMKPIFEKHGFNVVYRSDL